MQRTHVKKINEICVHSPPAWNKVVFGSSQPFAMVRSWWRHQKRSKRDVTSQNLKISLPQSCNGTSGTPGGRINWNFKIAQAEKGGGKPKMGHRRHTKNDPRMGVFTFDHCIVIPCEGTYIDNDEKQRGRQLDYSTWPSRSLAVLRHLWQSSGGDSNWCLEVVFAHYLAVLQQKVDERERRSPSK